MDDQFIKQFLSHGDWLRPEIKPNKKPLKYQQYFEEKRKPKQLELFP